MNVNSDIPLSLCIIKNHLNSLKEVENYLRGRKWNVSSFTNLKDAVNFIFQRPPQFILLSLDHSNSLVRELPDQLQNSYKIQVIGYSDNPAYSSSRALLETGVNYYIQPPVTGPALERIILQAQKDEIKRIEEELKNPSSRVQPPTPKQIEEARKALLTWINSDKGPSRIMVTGEVKAAPETAAVKGQVPTTKAPPTGTPAPAIEKKSIRKGKVDPKELEEVDIDHVPVDEPAPDDIFLHLQKNDKYILYTPEGYNFESQQKERLKKKGVKKMHRRKR